MQVIVHNNETTLSILKKFNKKTTRSRLSHYCVQAEVEEGILLFHTLTKELLLLSPEEYANLHQNDYLKEHFFLVPEGTNEKEITDLVRWIATTRQKKNTAITGYTIYPTTDCNARCFYCFELGRSRIPMTREVALKVVDYVKKHCEGQPVSFSWFGGEPLYNMEAIDTICDGLRHEGIEFTSRAVSNGYLFDENTVKKAKEEWNLKGVQITLDGTEQTYNKVKAFIYDGESPYQVVLNNIGYLLDKDILVRIRLNMDLYNAADLLQLVDELAQRFEGRQGITIYAHHLFSGTVPMAELHTAEEWEQREVAMRRLEEKIQQCGFSSTRGVTKRLRLNHCMADGGRSVTILPDGNIGLCEHFTENEFVGHIDREGFDSAVVESWKERMPEIPECAECFYYPECIKLKKCANESICYKPYREGKYRSTRRMILNEYNNWKNNATVENAEDVEDC